MPKLTHWPWPKSHNLKISILQPWPFIRSQTCLAWIIRIRTRQVSLRKITIRWTCNNIQSSQIHLLIRWCTIIIRIHSPPSFRKPWAACIRMCHSWISNSHQSCHLWTRCNWIIARVWMSCSIVRTVRGSTATRRLRPTTSTWSCPSPPNPRTRMTSSMIIWSKYVQIIPFTTTTPAAARINTRNRILALSTTALIWKEGWCFRRRTLWIWRWRRWWVIRRTTKLANRNSGKVAARWHRREASEVHPSSSIKDSRLLTIRARSQWITFRRIWRRTKCQTSKNSKNNKLTDP